VQLDLLVQQALLALLVQVALWEILVQQALVVSPENLAQMVRLVRQGQQDLRVLPVLLELPVSRLWQYLILLHLLRPKVTFGLNQIQVKLLFTTTLSGLR
jgi:hypothetical protein